IEIITAQGTVAPCRQHLEHAATQAQHGYIEGTATQVIDGHHALGAPVQPVGNGSSGRLVEQAQHIEAGQARSILGGLALSVIEVGRHGDHRPHQLPTQRRFRSLTQGTQDLRRDFYRALGALYRLDERHVRLAFTETVRQLLARSEEHTSELQSRENLVCRLLLEKKKQYKK